MTFLPIIERELRVRARNRATHWMRWAVALMGGLICLPQLMFAGAFDTPATVGRSVFNGIVSAAFLICCSACLLTAEAVGGERREGTLGLLLLTRVRALDMLIGKLGSVGITSLCALAAFLPILMIPILAGGVTGGEAARKGLGLLNLLFLALAAGLFTSARHGERFKAGWRSLVLVGGITLAPFLAALMLGRTTAATHAPAFALVSPLILLSEASDSAYGTAPGYYWISMSVVTVLSWVLLFWAGHRLRRSLLEEGSLEAVPAAGAVEATDRSVASGAWQAATDETDPIRWRVRQQRGLSAIVWTAALLGCCYYLLYVLLFRFLMPGRYMAGASWSLSFASGAATGALFAWAASRFFIESRRTGELELLLTTPQGARTIVAAQWNMLKRLVRWPLPVMLTPMLLQALFLLVEGGYGRGGPWRIYSLLSLLIGTVDTILGVGALCWLGLWFGLRARSQARAILWTVGLAKVLPYAFGFAVTVISQMVVIPIWGYNGAPYWVLMLLPRFVDLGWYVWLIQLARRRLALELTGREPWGLSLSESISHATWGAAKVIQRARHWTPS